MTGNNRPGGFPVIVVKHVNDRRYVPAHRVRCVDVYYLSVVDCPIDMTQRVLDIHGDRQGWAYVVTGLDGLWFTDLSNTPTYIPRSPRIRNWARGLFTVLQGEWTFVEFTVLYDYCTNEVVYPSENIAPYITTYIFTDYAIAGTVDCDGGSLGPSFRPCEGEHRHLCITHRINHVK